MLAKSRAFSTIPGYPITHTHCQNFTALGGQNVDKVGNKISLNFFNHNRFVIKFS